jgi:hypothetical protein
MIIKIPAWCLLGSIVEVKCGDEWKKHQIIGYTYKGFLHHPLNDKHAIQRSKFSDYEKTVRSC